MTEPTVPVLQCTGLTKSYLEGERRLVVLDGIDLRVDAGESVAIVGPSGSGKSTLLHILAGLDSADSGQVSVAGHDMVAADGNERAHLRGQYMGFVYQNHHLLPEFTALENVAMPLRIGGMKASDAQRQARQWLDAVGLAPRLEHRPHALSGGERQRVAVARSLAANPQVILADEPTGNLDTDNAAQVIELMMDLTRTHGTALVVVTHDTAMLERFSRVLNLTRGGLSAWRRDT